MISAISILKKLTDVFTKNPKSNMGKLITIMAVQLRDLEHTFETIQEWRDIDTAKGTTLDRIGENVVQPRGAATDEVYRIMIKSKIARNLSKADINTIIRVIAVALGTDYSDIEIKEQFNDAFDKEPAAISLLKMPIDKLNESGISLSQFIQIIQRTVAAGVKVSAVQLSGSFRFSSVSDQTTSGENGFGVGKFGYLYSPGDNTDLPI